MNENDFTVPPQDQSPESIATFARRRIAYRCARSVYEAIPMSSGRAPWEHMGSEARAAMASAALREIDAITP